MDSRSATHPASRTATRPAERISAEDHERIRRRAEEIFIQSGRVAGRDLENWVQAEEEIRSQVHTPVGPRGGIVIKVDGVRYIGEYSEQSGGGYRPGEFGAGDAITVRFEGGKMYVKRRNGLELETTLVRRLP